jgi:hypothetical protein
MSEPNDLSTLLDNAQSTQPQPIETARQPEPPTADTAQPSADTGDKQDAAPPAASDEGDDGPPVPRKALTDERRKRQDLERQLAELTKQRTAPPVQQQAQPQHQAPPPQAEIPERPDPWIDPQGAMDWDRAMMQQQIQTQVFETRTVLSREMMMSAKPDFQEVEAVFIEAARRAPHLVQALTAHPMPAKYAYETGLKIKAWNEIGDDPAAYKQRVREELEAERSGQQQTAPSQPQTPRGSTPKSLAATPSAQPRDQHGRFQGPASLESILGG